MVENPRRRPNSKTGYFFLMVWMLRKFPSCSPCFMDAFGCLLGGAHCSPMIFAAWFQMMLWNPFLWFVRRFLQMDAQRSNCPTTPIKLWGQRMKLHVTNGYSMWVNNRRSGSSFKGWLATDAPNAGHVRHRCGVLGSFWAGEKSPSRTMQNCATSRKT